MDNKQKIVVSSSAFYNSIANSYDGYLQVEGDTKIRSFVKEQLQEKVSSGVILDFGGGTGLDLLWLSDLYNVNFFEPAEKMRDVARNRFISKSSSHNITFADRAMDFTKWTSQNLPFSSKADGVIANFAVFNCIEDIDLLFDKIALAVNPGAYIFATVLDARITNIIRAYPVRTVLSSLIGKAKISSNYNGMGHTTYLHSLSEYKKYARQNFDFISYSYLGISNFSLLVLRKK